MAQHIIDRKFYEAVSNFEKSDEAKEYYYQVMDMETGRVTGTGYRETVRDQVLRAYGMLFCDDLDMYPGQPAGPDEVEQTADRLYTGAMQFDPRHWYRMQHHFPVIDEDNYDRFAALVISDLSAGPLRDAALNGGDMLLLGGLDPLHMTPEERASQEVRVIDLTPEGGESGKEEQE